MVGNFFKYIPWKIVRVDSRDYMVLYLEQIKQNRRLQDILSIAADNESNLEREISSLSRELRLYRKRYNEE
jgi:hypothetical protein